MKRFRFHLVALLLLSLLTQTGSAQGRRIVIQGTGTVNKLSISLDSIQPAGSPATEEFKKTLADDLTRSGWFKVLPGNAPLRVAARVTGRGSAVSVSAQLARANGAQVMSKALQAENVRRAAHLLSDALCEAVGRKGMAATHFLLVGNESGRKEIYICDSDGRNMIKLTSDKSLAMSPDWKPDGKSFVYTSFKSRFPSILDVDLTSRRRTALTKFPGLNSSGDVSPDGRTMALTLSKDGNPEIYTMDLRTQRLKRLTRTPGHVESSPCWSPDGRRLVYVSNSSGKPQLYTCNADGSGRRRLTVSHNESVAPDWGPDGRIAYSTKKFGKYHIEVIDPASGRVQALTEEFVDHEDPTWAPDGRHIAYTRTQAYRSNVYILDTEGDPQIRLTTLRGDWTSPSWSSR